MKTAQITPMEDKTFVTAKKGQTFRNIPKALQSPAKSVEYLSLAWEGKCNYFRTCAMVLKEKRERERREFASQTAPARLK